MSAPRFAIVVKRFPHEPPLPPGEDYFAVPPEIMVEAGCEVEVLTLRYPGQPATETCDGYRVHRFDSRRRLSAAIVFGRYALVHAHSHFPPAFLAGLLSRRAHTVFTSHSGELHATAWKRRVIVALMNRFDRVIALTPHESRVYRTAGVTPMKVVVIGHAINVAFFSKLGDPDRFRRRWKLPPDAVILLCVANVRHVKNPAVILRAFDRVRAQEPRTVLVMAGKDLLPSQRLPPITELARQVGVNAGLVLTDWLPADDLRDAYTAASIVLNSSASTEESFSISTWEAMAASRPVCLPRLGTFLSTVGDSALYHEPSEDAALAANVLCYLRDAALVSNHTRANRALVDQYAAPVMRGKLRALYTSLLKR